MNKVFAVVLISLLTCFGLNAQQTKDIEIGGFGLTVPNGLSPLAKAEREQKYTIQGQVPDEVYETDNDDVNISYMASFVSFEEANYPILKDNLEKQFTNPNSEILESSIVELGGKKFVLTQVILKENNVLMTNLVTEKAGKMVMLIISHSTNRTDYVSENKRIMNSLTLK